MCEQICSCAQHFLWWIQYNPDHQKLSGIYSRPWLRTIFDWYLIDMYSIPTPSNYKGMILIETLIYEKQHLTHWYVKNKNKTKIIIYPVTFRGIVNVEKYIGTFFPVMFFSTDATHTYDIILNTYTISILIPYSQW
jgi:hypothetical protein